MVIGIISYLPEDQNKRTHRFSTLKQLINVCNFLFNIHIYIVIQNYLPNEITELVKYRNVMLSDNNGKLGIVSARKMLRQWFLDSSYNNLIMLDDDYMIKGSMESGRNYLRQILNNPNCFFEFNDTLLKLFCISKELFKQVDYEDINPELEQGFEDRIFVSKLRELFPDRRRIIDKGNLEESSVSTKDEYSTWYTNQDLNKMIEQSYLWVENRKSPKNN